MTTTTLRTLDDWLTVETVSTGATGATLDELYAAFWASMNPTYPAGFECSLTGGVATGEVHFETAAPQSAVDQMKADLAAYLAGVGHTIAPSILSAALAVTGTSSFAAVARESTTLRVAFAGAGTVSFVARVDSALPDGITEAAHKELRDLIHFLDNGPGDGWASGAYLETLPSGSPFPTSETWWTSAAKTKRIVDLTINRNANKTPASEVWRLYASDGATVLRTLTDTISYSGLFETSRVRTCA